MRAPAPRRRGIPSEPRPLSPLTAGPPGGGGAGRGRAPRQGTPEARVWPTPAGLALEGAGAGGERGGGRRRPGERVGGGADVRPGPGRRRPLPRHILAAALAAGPGGAPRSRAASRAATGERAGAMRRP